MAPLKRTFSFASGNNQSLSAGSCHVDTKACEKCGLTTHGRYFPLVIRIVLPRFITTIW